MWPLSPLTNYSAGTLPAIKAADLNAIQDAINRLITGTYSVKALVIDGTGGAVVAPAASTLSVAGSATASTFTPTASCSGSTTTPPFTLPAIPAGVLYRERMVFGSANVVISAGAIGRVGGHNVSQVTRAGTGSYSIEFNGDRFGAGLEIVPVVSVVAESLGQHPIASFSYILAPAGRYQVGVRVYNPAGTLVDPLAILVLVV